MRAAVIASTLTLAALLAVTIVPQRGLAQQLPAPPNGFRPPPAAPVKAYKPVAAAPPAPYDDPSFQSFRKQLVDVAAHKDRAALAKLTVAHGFFWMQDKDLAEPGKPGVDNLATAIDLDANNGPGWLILSGFASDPTATDLPDHKGVICAPSDPAIDPKQFEALAEATQTDPTEWGYPTKDGVEVRAAAEPGAAVVDKLGLNLVRVLSDSGSQGDATPPAFLHVATPSGKTGFAATDAIAPLGGDQICYAKDASGWKIAGYFGGAAP